MTRMAGGLLLSVAVLLAAPAAAAAGVGKPPVAADDSYAVPLGKVLQVGAQDGVLGNDHDPEGSRLSAVLVRPASFGRVTLRADGSFTYVPRERRAVTDVFTYAASDGGRLSDEVRVQVKADAAPVAVPDLWGLRAPGPALQVPAPGVLANDRDAARDVLQVRVVEQPLHGSLVLWPDGGFSYLPAKGFLGNDRFVYRATDGNRVSAPVRVAIRVGALRTGPVLPQD